MKKEEMYMAPIKKVFIEYEEKQKDGSIKVVTGMFDLLDSSDNRIKFDTGKNIVILPDHSWNKIKISKDTSLGERRLDKI